MRLLYILLVLVLVSGCVQTPPLGDVREEPEEQDKKPGEGVILIDKPLYRAELWKSRGYSIQSFVHKLTGNELHAPGVEH